MTKLDDFMEDLESHKYDPVQGSELALKLVKKLIDALKDENLIDPYDCAGYKSQIKLDKWKKLERMVE